MNAFPSPDGNEGEGRAEVAALRLVVGPDESGDRLDVFLSRHMPDHVSRSRVKALILEGSVSLNAAACATPNRRVKAGDRIALVVPEPGAPAPAAQAIPLDILYEDDEVIVIVKPAGMVVHPAPGNADGTLVNALIHHCGGSLTGIGGVRRPGIVHRLDKDTSGVMVVAKSERAHAALSAQFADHGRSGPLDRGYLALVWGEFSRPSGKVDAPLGRSPANRLRRAVVAAGAPDARHAVTHYRVARRFGSGRSAVSLVECRLETGRTHQIRVHMAHAGHPLLGDREYGGHFATKAGTLAPAAAAAVSGFPRQALHAAKLVFAHPADGRIMRFSAPPPEDFSALVQALETNG